MISSTQRLVVILDQTTFVALFKYSDWTLFLEPGSNQKNDTVNLESRRYDKKKILKMMVSSGSCVTSGVFEGSS